MVNIKNILKKDNLIGAAGLGAGSLGAEVVLSKVAPMLPDAAAKFAPALPILAGLVKRLFRHIINKVLNL
jgi:hypothetical protein